MPYKDLQDFIQTLEQRQELKRIKVSVSQDLEITEITDRVVKKGGPALLFENVTGHTIPVAINLFGSYKRMAIALELDDINRLPERLTRFMSFAYEPPTGFIEKLKAIPRFMEIASFLPKKVNDGICKEVILKDDQVDLLKFPIIKCWQKDAARFITYPLVFTHDPESSIRNCGVYRMQVFDKNATGMHFHPHKDAARHLARSKGRLEAAVAIGSDPAVCFSGALPLPPDMDEMIFAGLLREDGVKMIKCETVNVEVPANSEIVLEGYIDPLERRVEGPFGDHTGFYSEPAEFPVFHVTCITHRKNPIYHAIVVGPPPAEDDYIGYAIERLFLPLLRLQLPEVVDYHLPFEGCFNNLMLVAIKKQYAGHARKVMHAIWGMGQAMFTKCIAVFDDDVDIHNPREVVWKLLTSIDPKRDIEFVQGPIDMLDHASSTPCYGSKMGIDATRKWKDEGYTGKWPDEIKNTAEIKAIVDKKMAALGDLGP